MKTDKLFYAFIFLMSFPFFSLFGNNVSFYIFLLIILFNGRNMFSILKHKFIFIIFLLLVFLSAFTSSFYDFPRKPGFFNQLLGIIKYSYWLLIPIYLIHVRKSLNFIKISKVIFIGSKFLILGFFISHSSSPFDLIDNYNLGIMSLNFNSGRNPFVFNLLALIPINYYYLIKIKSSNLLLLAYTLFILIVMLLTNGRAGFIILCLEILFIFIMFRTTFFKFTLVILIPATIFLISSPEKTDNLKEGLANIVEPISFRVSDLIRGEGESGDLGVDKSWLIRRLMIDKGFEIFLKYPFSGIGPNNFSFYDSTIKNIRKYPRLYGDSTRFYNTLSAHNSYIKILTEIGIFGFICFIMILYRPLSFLFKKVLKGKSKIDLIPMVSLFGISIHFYVFSALQGALSWFIIAIAWVIKLNK